MMLYYDIVMKWCHNVMMSSHYNIIMLFMMPLPYNVTSQCYEVITLHFDVIML